jgi:hypothetical protein
LVTPKNFKIEVVKNISNFDDIMYGSLCTFGCTWRHTPKIHDACILVPRNELETEDEKVLSTLQVKQKSNEFEIASIICRQANKRQKEHGVDVPAAKAGLIKWGQLRKNIYESWVRGSLGETRVITDGKYKGITGGTKIFGITALKLSWHWRVTSCVPMPRQRNVMARHHDASRSVHYSLRSNQVIFLLSTMYVLFLSVTHDLHIHTYIRELQPN